MPVAILERPASTNGQCHVSPRTTNMLAKVPALRPGDIVADRIVRLVGGQAGLVDVPPDDYPVPAPDLQRNWQSRKGTLPTASRSSAHEASSGSSTPEKRMRL